MDPQPAKPSRTGSAPVVRAADGGKQKKPGVLKRLVRRVKSAFSFRRPTGRIAPAAAYAPSPVSADDSDAVVLVTSSDMVGQSGGGGSSGGKDSPFRTPSLKAGHAHMRSGSGMRAIGDDLRGGSGAGAGGGTGSTTSPMSSVAASGTDNLSPFSTGVGGGAVTPTEDEDPFFTKAAQVFGPAFKAEMCSGKWQDRQQLLKRITAVMASGTIKVVNNLDDRLQLLDCVCGLVVRCLSDKVAPVTWAVMEVFWSYITSDLCVFGRDAPAASPSLSSVVPPLLSKMAEKNARTFRDSRKCILALARNRGVAGYNVVAPTLVDASQPLLPRLDVLLEVVPEFRFRKGSALSPATVLSVAVPALSIAHDVTRRSAIDVVVATYKLTGKRVSGHLKDVKPAILKILHRRFNEVDGVHTLPSHASSSSSPSRSSPVASENARMMRSKSGMLSPLRRPMARGGGNAYLPTLSLGSPSQLSSFPAPDLVPRDTNTLPCLTGTSSNRYFDAQDEALMSSILSDPVAL